MAYDRIMKRHARNRGRNRQILSLPQQDWRGVNAVDDIYSMPGHQITPAQNADLGSPVGSITKVAGFESLFPSLGAGQILGLHGWKHPDGDKFIAAWDKYLHLLSGETGSIAKTTQEDWDAGTGEHVDTAATPGDIALPKTGEGFSKAVTATADFNGMHDKTVAAENSVKLTSTSTGNVIAALGAVSSTLSIPADYGWQFTVGPNNVTATKLRCYMYQTKSTYLRLWRVSDGAKIAEVLVSGVANTWVEGDIDDLTLMAGASYVVSARFSTWEDGVNNTTTPTLDSSIATIDGGGSNFGKSGTMPTIAAGTTAYGIADVVLSRTAYAPLGTYTHGEYDISAVGTVKTATITFNKTTPANTACTVDVRICNGGVWGAWKAKASGDAIIEAGTDVSNYRVQVRANLSTASAVATPSLDDFTIAVTSAYYALGEWVSPVYDLEHAPFTTTLSWTQDTPEGSSLKWYARGSGGGTVFGDWREITASGSAIPLQRYVQIRIVLAGTLTATPAVHSLLISYSFSYTQVNRLDVSPLGRTDNKLTGNRVSFQDYDNRCYCADGLRPFVLYVDDATITTGTARGGTASTVALSADASPVVGYYNNAFITITGGAGEGQVRFIFEYSGTSNIVAVSEPWTTIPDATSTYSISAAVKARNAGVDPPNTACKAAEGSSAELTGTYKYKVAFVNQDGYESNPSGASNAISVTNKNIALSDIPIGDSTIIERKIYRTKNNGAVFYYVDTLENNTATTYSDTTTDTGLSSLMLDNNNIPVNCSLVYSFLTYMFYVFMDELWFSKATEPESVPAIVGDVQNIICPGLILDIKHNPTALIPMGQDFVAPITTSTGFIFDSDPLVDSTTMRIIANSGSLSAWASDICITSDLRSILSFPSRTGIMALLPGLQEESIESFPLSRNIQTYIDRSVNRESIAGIYHNGRYYVSFQYQADGASGAQWVTFACDFRQEGREWCGPWTYGASCYVEIGGILYAGDPQAGKIYLMGTGNSFDGEKIRMIADTRMLSPQGENFTYRYNNFMIMVSAESDTTELIIKPKVDNREASIMTGKLVDTFAGDKRAGHDNIRSRKFRIPLARGSTLSYRIEDDSTNPLSIQKIIAEAEVLPLKR